MKRIPCLVSGGVFHFRSAHSAYLVSKFQGMIKSSTFAFLSELNKNNNKEWFDGNRQDYEAARQDVAQFADALIAHLGRFDPALQHLTARDCMYRINRDIRFSADKTPYKTNFAVYMSRYGKKAMDAAGYYLHIEPGKCFMAGGLWMPPSPPLRKLRSAIDFDWTALDEILKDKNFFKTFGDFQRDAETMLQRPPKGYNADHPGIAYLKLKSFIMKRPVEDAYLQGINAAVKLAKDFALLKPLVYYLNENIRD